MKYVLRLVYNDREEKYKQEWELDDKLDRLIRSGKGKLEVLLISDIYNNIIKE